MLGKLLELNVFKILFALATMIGAFGGFPEPPHAFSALAQYQVVQWGLLFVLIYQGGGGADPVLSLVATIATFFMYKFVRLFESGKENNLETEIEAEL